MMTSIVEYYAEHSGYRCGYCNSSDTNYSHGMWAHTLRVSDYQDLMDRGWRRSGKYCYKPTMNITCCPMYTIRCNALQFKATKSQKKVLKYFNKYFMEDGNLSSKSARKMSTSNSKPENECLEEGREIFVETTREHQTIDIPSDTQIEVPPASENQSCVSLGTQENNLVSTTVSESSKSTNLHKVIGPDPSRPACKKAKELRRQRKLEKLKVKGVNITNLPNTSANKEKSLEDFINEIPEEFKNKLQVKLVRTSPQSQEWKETSKETYEVYVKYQTVIHNDKPEKITEAKFKDFLVQSPLMEEHSESGPPCGYGSFHQQYWLNGKIVAVGVIDILPKCVSSVYFFYDPDYMHLTLGTYGALREIEFTRLLNKSSPQLQYYYMGFYIHTCKKMRYKGNFCPSDLLCPETYKWVPIEESIPLLERSPYTRLNPDIDGLDDNMPGESDLNYIPIWHKGKVMLNKVFRRSQKNKEDTAELMEYGSLVGKRTLNNLVLFRE